MDLSAARDALLLPAGTRLVHIGPSKTGTTSLQAALWAGREAMLAQGVRHAGRTRNPASAVRAVTGQLLSTSEGAPPAMSHWRDLVREVRHAREPRVVISSEFFAWAKPEAIRRIVDDLDPARVHIAVTLRPLARILPSQWQQSVQTRSVASYDRWLDAVLNRPADSIALPFWLRHRHDQLIARWAEVVGPQNVTVVVVDERDHAFVLRVFEQLVGLREGTLVADRDLANRSLTMAEVEAVRAFNLAFRREGLGKALHAMVMHFGAGRFMKMRVPGPDEARIETPQWALDRAGEIAREMVANIATSGVRVVGDLDSLTVVPTSQLTGDRQPEVSVPPDVAASLAMGVLLASGLARRSSATGKPGEARATRSGVPRPWLEPIELARVPTPQLVAALVGRTRAAAVRRWWTVRRRIGLKPGR